MKRVSLILSLFALAFAAFVSCNKWKDPDPVTDPRLTNLYCNNPAAVNYNLGFPGQPDNSVCYFPSDLFVGRYLFRDSVYLNTTGLFLSADSIELIITKKSDEAINVFGFCGSKAISLTAGPTYVATVDTTDGTDSTTLNPGQILCRTQDTLSGTISKDRVDSNLLYIVWQIVSDTGITVHIGKATKH